MITRNEAEARITAGGTISRSELSDVLLAPGNMTAGEMERLSLACPEWVAERDAQEAQRQAIEEESIDEQAMLLADLRRAGYRIRWIWDFVNTADDYTDVIPVLVDHLRRPYSDGTREGIARALAVREARGIAGSALVGVLKEAGRGKQLRWALANSLTLIADRSNRDDIKMLIDIETDCDVRQRLMRALKTAAKP